MLSLLINLENQHNVNLEYLEYSNVQEVKDDPVYSIALGAKVLAEKWKIERSIKDVTQMNASLQIEFMLLML
jgi:LPS O-antigen subunit length determinant protein (WzzB/FepE family)